MDKQTADKFMKDTQAILRKAYSGWDVDVKSASYNRDGFVDIKVRIMEKGKTAEGIALEQIASWYGFDLSVVADIPRIGKCTLIGYNSRARKYPFIVLRLSDEQKYKIGERLAEEYFA